MLSEKWLSRYGLLENFNASVTRTRTGTCTGTGTGTWTTEVTAIALCTSRSRAKNTRAPSLQLSDCVTMQLPKNVTVAQSLGWISGTIRETKLVFTQSRPLDMCI